MSRKLNNLRNRMRIQTEKFASRVRDLIYREQETEKRIATARAAEEKLRRTRALSISVDEVSEDFRRHAEEFAVTVYFSPDMFVFRAMRTNPIANLSYAAQEIGREVGYKVTQAIVDRCKDHAGISTQKRA